jgi:hypothetical protein
MYQSPDKKVCISSTYQNLDTKGNFVIMHTKQIKGEGRRTLV